MTSLSIPKRGEVWIGALDAGELDDIAYRVALCIGLKPF